MGRRRREVISGGGEMSGGGGGGERKIDGLGREVARVIGEIRIVLDEFVEFLRKYPLMLRTKRNGRPIGSVRSRRLGAAIRLRSRRLSLQ